MADDIVLTARLDNQRVVDSLKEISEESDKMAERSRGSVQLLAKRIQNLQEELEDAQKTAATGKGVFVEGFTKGEQSAEEFNKSILQLLNNLKKISATAKDAEPIVTGPGESKARSFAADDAGIKQAEVKYKQLEEILARIFDRGSESAKQYAALLQNLGTSWANEQAAGADEVNQELGQLISKGKELERSLDFDDVDVAENLKLENVENEFNSLKETSGKLLNNLSADAKRFGSEMSDSLDQAAERFGQTGNIQQYKKEIQAITSETNKFQKTLERSGKADLAKQLNTEQARKNLNQLNETTKALLDSTSKRAQNLGAIYRKMGVESFQAFKRGEITAKQFNNELRKTEGLAKADARSFGLLAQEGNRASASMFKLGLTFDRLGARGPATALRLTDALKGIHPATVGAALGVVALTVVVTKLAQAFFELAKKATKAFIDISKEAVMVAGNFSDLEDQLVNIFKGNERVARATLKRILDLSADFGVDLTESLAQIFLPLVENFEQFERIGEIASTMMVSFNQTQEAVARALKQGQAEQFVTLQRTFFLTDAQVAKIEAQQEKLGVTEGLIAGMEQFLKETGRQWDTYEDNLNRVLGTFDIFKKQFLLAFGEPIENEVVAALINIRNWIDENKPALEQFVNSIGQVVGRVVGTIGDFVSNILDDIDTEQLDEVAESFNNLGSQVEQLVETIDGLSGEEFNPLIDGATALNDALAGVVDNTRIIIAFFAGLKEIGEGVEGEEPDFLARRALLTSIPGFQGLIAFAQLQDFIKNKIGRGEEPPPLAQLSGEKAGEPEFDPPDTSDAVENLEEYEEALEKVRKAQEELLIQQERTFEDLFGEVIGQDLDAKIESVEERIIATQKYLETLEAVKVDLIDIDFDDLDGELSKAQTSIETWAALSDQAIQAAIQGGERLSEEQRKILDLQLEFYRKREDAARDHLQKIEDIQLKRSQQDRDQATKHGDKLDDISTSYQDKLIDIEIEKAKKIEQIETKHRDRLLEIRKRFDFDAQEAARKNDAVALLRIRRRMELELDLAESRSNEQKRDVGKDAADRRAAAKRELDREVRDQEEANRRKLRDIAQSFEDQIDAIQAAYERQINTINEQERRKREDLLLWMKEQLDDFKENNERKLEDLERTYVKELAIIRKWEARIHQERIRFQDLRDQISYGGGTGGSGTGSRFGEVPENVGAPQPGSGGGSVVNPNMASWRSEAIKLANELGKTEIIPHIEAASSAAQVRNFMNWLRGLKGLPPRQHGGRVGGGMSVMTGEGGAEPFTPVQAGIISPNSPSPMPTMLRQVPNVSTDNSRTVTANMSMLDPSQMSPVQISIIKNIVTEEILKSEAI